MCIPYNEWSGNYRLSVFTLGRFEMMCPVSARKYVRRAIGAFLAIIVAIPLILRVYVIQEFIAALILFSVVCAAVALLVLILLLPGTLIQELFLKPPTAERERIILARRLQLSRRVRPLPMVVR
jgi:hypothetical protein